MKYWLMATIALCGALIGFANESNHGFEQRDAVRRAAMESACRASAASNTELTDARREASKARDRLAACPLSDGAVLRDLDGCTCVCPGRDAGR